LFVFFLFFCFVYVFSFRLIEFSLLYVTISYSLKTYFIDKTYCL